ncbi:MAG: hypothetical protein WCG42_09490 [Parachlamydiaceae bacterium]
MDPSTLSLPFSRLPQYQLVQAPLTSRSTFASGLEDRSCLSTYIHSKSPLKYGYQQQDYLERAESAIQQTVSRIRAGVEDRENLTDLFFVIRKELCTIRGQIAKDHGTANAELFGRFRASVDFGEYTSPVTPLYGCYKEYNTIFMEQLSKIMTTRQKCSESKKIETEDVALERTTTCTVQVLDEKDVRSLKLAEFPSEEELHRVLDTPKRVDEIVQDYELMKELKAKNLSLYQRYSSFCYFEFLHKNFPVPTLSGCSTKNYALCTLRLEINKKLFAMTRYLTRVYPEKETGTLKPIIGYSVALLIHQDPLLIQSTLQAISEMFEKCLLWNPGTETVQELKNRVTLFRFTYAHCMPRYMFTGS